MIYLLALVVLFLVIIFYNYLTWHWNYWKRRGIPGPLPKLLFGSFIDSMLQKKSVVYEVDEYYQKYKDETPFIGGFSARLPCVIVTDAEMVKNILTKDFKHFQKNEFGVAFDKNIDPLFGRNPFLLSGDEWKEKRSEITPAFTSSRIKAMYAIVKDVQCKMNKYIQKELNGKSQELFNAKELSAKFTIDVVSNCIYGIDSKAFSDDKCIMREMGEKLFSQSPILLLYFTFIAIVPQIHQIIRMPIVSKDIEHFFTKLLTDAVELRKHTGQSERADYLNYLLELKKKKNISDLDMAAHTITFFFDGFETSNAVIAHVLYLLAEYPHVQTKLRSTINEYVVKNDEIKFEDINEMEYLDAVFNETLRLYPPGTILRKICTESIELINYKDKKCLIEKGTPIFLPIYSIHRDQKYYENPHEFRPERFQENGGIKAFREKGVFYPFGDGPRQCLGMRFATMQSKAAIIEIVSNFELLPSNKSIRPYVIHPKKLIIEPFGGLWVNLKKIDK